MSANFSYIRKYTDTLEPPRPYPNIIVGGQ